MADPVANTGTGAPAAGHSASSSVPPVGPGKGTASPAEAVEAVAGLARESAQVGLAWLELFQAEVAVARASAVRLLGAVVLVAIMALIVWGFACLALGFLLAGVIGRLDAAMAIVAALNLLLIGALTLAMRRWWRNLQMRHSRAALADIGKAFSS